MSVAVVVGTASCLAGSAVEAGKSFARKNWRVDGVDVRAVMRTVLCDALVVAYLRVLFVKFTKKKVKKKRV